MAGSGARRAEPRFLPFDLLAFFPSAGQARSAARDAQAGVGQAVLHPALVHHRPAVAPKLDKAPDQRGRALEARARVRDDGQLLGALRHKRRRVKFYYWTQVSALPPTFVVSSNMPEGVPSSYRRFMVSRLRELFDFEGTPVRLIFRKRGENPDKPQKSKTRGKR